MSPISNADEKHKPAKQAALSVVSSRTAAYPASSSTRYFAPRSYPAQNALLDSVSPVAISATDKLRSAPFLPICPPIMGIFGTLKSKIANQI